MDLQVAKCESGRGTPSKLLGMLKELLWCQLPRLAISGSLSNTLNTPSGVWSMVNKQIEEFLNGFSTKCGYYLRFTYFWDWESHTSIAPLQHILQIEDDHEEFHPSESERNIQIPLKGQLRCSERAPVPQRHFDIEN